MSEPTKIWQKNVSLNGLKDAINVSLRRMCVEFFWKSFFNDLRQFLPKIN